MSGKNLKQKQQKTALVEQLKKMPIIEVACKRMGISRAAYYVWRKQDIEFANMADTAIQDGVLYINDLAESGLLSQIKDNDLQAIKFWLIHRHSAYAAKLQVNANLNAFQEQLSPDQQKVVDEALRLLSLSDGEEVTKGEKENETDAGNN